MHREHAKSYRMVHNTAVLSQSQDLAKGLAKRVAKAFNPAELQYASTFSIQVALDEHVNDFYGIQMKRCYENNRHENSSELSLDADLNRSRCNRYQI